MFTFLMVVNPHSIATVTAYSSSDVILFRQVTPNNSDSPITVEIQINVPNVAYIEVVQSPLTSEKSKILALLFKDKC
ncbi:hypothetical protein [Bacillus toyonensis]|uniref:hypothetical protein n=1 Tax=Bacillus toyonensis TaxID=155322 RepID=UPI000BF159E0|nr:hypothetical protein [Bacillus toyonensis]PEJ86725.1 hypothetical protein CN688_28755 [Bacillus toyonensis]PEL18195.1 hypothetical protein CN624_29380 [Bacillus toyonensis]PGA67198.1 hypothetical protein COL90_32550 [Bacillus toyonensis]